MQDWPFPWECGKLQWRTQLKGRGLAEVREELENYLDKIYSQKKVEEHGSLNESINPSSSSDRPGSLQEIIEGAEKDLRLIEKWMDFCK
jgi:hypothetical protein